MKQFIVLLALAQLITAQPLYKGPAQGSVQSGVIVNTSGFLKSETVIPREKIGRNKIAPAFDDLALSPETSPFDPLKIYSEDAAAGKGILDTAAPVLIRDWQGIPQTNSIPPDPHCAVGPEHIIATVNADFAIYDKLGNRLVRIQASSWFRDLFGSVSPFDPKVIYDHYAKRWVMVWLDQDNAAQFGYFFISVSDDSIPLGTWYNYMLPSNVNGTTNDGTWSDYQGVGFDDKALYITGNQFSFGSSFKYTKIRIIPKTQLYANTAGQLSWFDLWDIRNPASLNSVIFNIRPSLSFNAGDSYNLLHSPPGSANYVLLYKITNPASAPVMTANRITVSQFSSPPSPRQLGNNSITLESSSTALNNEPVYRDGKLWAVHTTRNPAATSYSAVHYMGIDVQTNTSVSEGFFGASGFYYMYPSVMVDKHNNLCVTYSRTGPTEYIGAYFAGRKQSDPPGLSGSVTIQTGKGDYVQDFGSGRNRWGDYMGIWLDPVTQQDFYMLTEYVPSQNRWGTWLGVGRVQPYTGAQPFFITKTLDLGNVEIGSQSEIKTALVSNFGDQPVTVTSIAFNSAIFKLTQQITFPRVLATYDTLRLPFRFEPNSVGKTADTLRFYSGANLLGSIVLKGNGYLIRPAANKTVYAVSNGNVIRVSKTTGSGTALGASGFTTLASLAVHPASRVVYGLYTGTGASGLVRVNAQGGDAYLLSTFSLPFTSMAFDTSGKLYLAISDGRLYRYDIGTAQLVKTDSAKAPISCFAFHPATNELWAAVYRPVGDGRDALFKVRIPSGDTSLVGTTGLNAMTMGMFFDENAALYGVKTSSSFSELFGINQTTGQGAVIGSTGFNWVSGLVYDYLSPLVGVEDARAELPESFLTARNYPNPFNPATKIRYRIPEAPGARSSRGVFVTLKIYDMLGREITTLVNEEKQAGEYEAAFSAASLPSGAYFYELRANGNTAMGKMIVTK